MPLFIDGVDRPSIAKKDGVRCVESIDRAECGGFGDQQPGMPNVLLKEVAQQAGSVLRVNNLAVDARVPFLSREKGHDPHNQDGQKNRHDRHFDEGEPLSIFFGLNVFFRFEIHQRFSRLKRNVEAATDLARPSDSVQVTRISMERVSLGTTS